MTDSVFVLKLLVNTHLCGRCAQVTVEDGLRGPDSISDTAKHSWMVTERLLLLK